MPVIVGVVALVGCCCTMSAIAGVLLATNGSRRAHQLRIAREVAPGRAAGTRRLAVRGTIAAGPAGELRSPLSDRPCVWWSVKVTRFDRGEDREIAHVVVDRCSPAPFALIDPSGAVLVDGSLASGSALSSADPRVMQPMAEIARAMSVAPHGAVLDRVVTAGLAPPHVIKARRRTRRFAVTEILLPAGLEATAIGHLRPRGNVPVLGRRPAGLAALRPETRAELLALLDGERRQNLRASAAVGAFGIVLLVLAFVLTAPGWRLFY